MVADHVPTAARDGATGPTSPSPHAAAGEDEGPDRNRELTVTVAVLTRRRPAMLDRLIDSWGRLRAPADCAVRFLVVENDDAPQVRAQVEDRGSLPLGPLHYVLEREAGIPFGRNRAAREAIAAGHRLLAFVDDDEMVAADWLMRLIDSYRSSGAALIGAPLGIVPAPDGLTWTQRRMHASLSWRYARKAALAAARGGLDGTPGVTIVTNNWLAETAVFALHGIWFDEAMRFTGGTDAKLSAEVKAAGLPTAWAADAHVYEDVPPERLSFAYQYRRARDQSNTNFHRKLATDRALRASVIVTLPLKALSVVGLALAVPLTNGATLIDVARTAGWMAGRIGALRGGRSMLYRTTTGS